TLQGGSALADSVRVTLADAAGTTLTLEADEAIGSLAGGGASGGLVQLGAHTLTMGGDGSSSSFAGSVSGSGGLVKVGAGTFTLSGVNRYTGTTDLQAGVLTLAGGQALDDASTVRLADAAGATLNLQADETIGALAGGGNNGGRVALGDRTLTTGANGTDTRFDGTLDGSGGLVKVGAGTFTLGGANGYTGLTAVRAGTLLTTGADRLAAGSTLQVFNGASVSLGGDQTLAAIADGAGETADGSAAIRLADHRLTVGDAGSSVFSGVLSGAGGLSKVGSGSLTLAGANTYTGLTVVEAGTLATRGNERIADASGLQVANGATFRLGGTETVASLADRAGQTADGTATVDLTSFGLTAGDAADTTFTGLLTGDATATAVAQFTKQGSGTLTLANPADNRYAGKTAIAGGVLRIGRAGHLGLAPAAQTAAADHLRLAGGGSLEVTGDLPLGNVTVEAGGDSRIDATGTLALGGNLVMAADARLALVSRATPTYTAADVAPGVVDPDGRVLHVASDVITQSTGSRITTADGSGLLLVSVAGGSIRLGQEANDFGGHVAALSSNGATLTPTSFGSAWTANVEGGGVGAALPARQSVITLAGQNLRIGSQTLALEGGGSLAVNGVAGDLVRLTAGTLRTDPGSLIRARLWYNDAAFGTIRSTPGLQLTLLDPLAYEQDGTFGNSDAPIAVEVGAITTDAPRAGLSAGFVQVLPKNGARGSTAIYLTGPRIAAGLYSFFHDGAGQLSEVPVLYNGFLPASPQLSGSLSSVASVSEQARKERFEEAVRTENVAVRLRAGVIAEVGPGRPATQGSDGIRLPEQCEPSWPALDCAK
ncbi:MAG: autotransporter-associated beta strand repeat-containing protein, partial [Aquincola sp.]|nr:autotransporter-associated beta strand repeat-containing protein [Aquincola sp.]